MKHRKRTLDNFHVFSSALLAEVSLLGLTDPQCSPPAEVSALHLWQH